MIKREAHVVKHDVVTKAQTNVAKLDCWYLRVHGLVSATCMPWSKAFNSELAQNSPARNFDAAAKYLATPRLFSPRPLTILSGTACAQTRVTDATEVCHENTFSNRWFTLQRCCGGGSGSPALARRVFGKSIHCPGDTNAADTGSLGDTRQLLRRD